MSKERIKITQEMCIHAEILLKGGANMKQTAELLGVSPATVSRMKAAGFEVVRYNMMTDRRRIQEKDRQADRTIEQLQDQLKGQMKMELLEEKEEYSEQTKMMRFQAGQVALLMQKMEKIYDMMGQILRAVRGD